MMKSDPPSAETSRFNAAVDRRWNSVIWWKARAWTGRSADARPPVAARSHLLIMSAIRSICVYCASGPGNTPTFMDAAASFGRVLAKDNIGLVYGGGSVGLMGAMAEAVLDGGGRVTGVIPEFLVNREHMLLRVQERIVTRDMHERKRIMFERADAFVALPGGIGTLEEPVEQLTWAQLGRHRKPILILNIEGFWDPLCALIDHMRRLDFIRADLSVRLLVVEKVDEILPKLFEEARLVAEPEKEMVPIVAERM